MKISKIVAAAAIVAASASTSHAATYALGDVGGGANVTNTLSAGVLDYYTFSYGTGGTYINFDTLGSNTLSGIDTEIGLYDSLGTRVALNDDYSGLDSGINFPTWWTNLPAAGDYTLVVGAYNTYFYNDINDIVAGNYSSGAYNLNISTDISAVPLPAGGLLLISGLFGVAALRRKKKAA